MKTTKMATLAATMAALSILLTSSLGEADDPAQRAGLAGIRALTGLKGVYVLVENISPDAEADGLDRSTLAADVERELRRARITVLSRPAWRSMRGLPYLSLRVGTFKNALADLYAYHIELELVQGVVLVRAPDLTIPATTWSARSITGTVGVGRLSELRVYVQDCVDQFVNAYLAANPAK